MDEILSQIWEFRKEVEKLKAFCAYVAIDHEKIPQLERIWNGDIRNFIYGNNPRHDELNAMKAAIMKKLLELEDRIGELEKSNKQIKS